MNNAKRTLRAIAADIAANARSYPKHISFEEFDRRARALWREVDLGLPCIIGSRSGLRMTLTRKYLREAR